MNLPPSICGIILWGDFWWYYSLGDFLAFSHLITTVPACLLFVKAAEPWYQHIFLRDVFLVPGFPCHECLLDTYYKVPVSYSICFMFRATVRVCKAPLLDPYSLGIPVFSMTSLSYALHIPSVPLVYFRTRAFVFVFSFLGLPVFGCVILLSLGLRVVCVTT